MTICSKMYEALDKRLEEKKSLDEIGSELCDAVIDPRGKAIRLIKQSKGEQYLKENAEWLGYVAGNANGANAANAQKNSRVLEEEAIREDARSVGMQTGGFIRQEPSYEKQSPLTVKSMQDSFQPDEVVYEKQDAEIIPQCRIFIPKLSDIKKCPCGCGYGYCDINEKWYSKMDIKNLSED